MLTKPNSLRYGTRVSDSEARTIASDVSLLLAELRASVRGLAEAVSRTITERIEKLMALAGAADSCVKKQILSAT